MTIHVNSETGEDINSCVAISSSSSPSSSACKTLHYALSTGIARASQGDDLLIMLETRIEKETIDVQDNVMRVKMIRLVDAAGGRGEIRDSRISILAYVTFSGMDILGSSLTVWQNTFVDTLISFSQISATSLKTSTGTILSPNTNFTMSTIQNTTSTFQDLSVYQSEFWNSPVVVNGTCFVSSSRFSNSSSSSAMRVFSCTIEDSTFSHNSAAQDGGAIYAVTSLIVNRSNFTHNNAKSNGGAIYSIGVLRLEGSTFNNNSAYYGGAICIKHITATPALVFQCSASSMNDNNAEMGGGISIHTGKVMTTYESPTCTLTRNTATQCGGGLYVYNATFRGSAQWTFNDNAAEKGGAIYIAESYAEISGVTSNNAVRQDGASVYAVNSDVELSETRIGTPWNLWSSNSTSVHLIHSSSQLAGWYDVSFDEGIETNGLYCDDCEKALCPAVHSCADCNDGCISFLPKKTSPSVYMCTSAPELVFGCEHKSTCKHVEKQKTVCTCKEGYRSDLCTEREYSFRSFPVYVKVLLAIVGSIALIAVIILISRKIMARREANAYQPL